MSTLYALPEETIHEILSVCLTPNTFFVGYEHSRKYGSQCTEDRNSQLLLVSKQWLRIGTPILYRHLRLTNQERTKTVAQVLAANEGLGRAVRALRLEGGMGRELHKIVSCTPNIESLYLARYYLKSIDSLSGFRRALPHLNVKKLYYERIVQRNGNKITDELDALVTEGMLTHWRELNLVGFVHESSQSLSAEMVGAVVRLLRLKEVQFDSDDLEFLLYPRRAGIPRLAMIPALKTVRAYGLASQKSIRKELKRQLVSSEFLAKLVFVKTEDDERRERRRFMYGDDTSSDEE